MARMLIRGFLNVLLIFVSLASVLAFLHPALTDPAETDKALFPDYTRTMIETFGKNMLIVLFVVFNLGMWGLFIGEGIAHNRRRRRREAHLRDHGIQAPAIIRSVEDTRVTYNEINYGVRLHLEVQPPGEPPFEATLDTIVSRVSVPRPGDQLQVIYDPTDRQNITLA
jgi:hypothetical protein